MKMIPQQKAKGEEPDALLVTMLEWQGEFKMVVLLEAGVDRTL